MAKQEERRNVVQDLIDRARAQQARPGLALRVQDPELEEAAPCVAAFLYPAPSADGKRDAGGLLTVWSEGETVRVVLVDKATEHRLYGSGPTLSQAIQSLDDQLGADSADWRPPVAHQGRRKKS